MVSLSTIPGIVLFKIVLNYLIVYTNFSVQYNFKKYHFKKFALLFDKYWNFDLNTQFLHEKKFANYVNKWNHRQNKFHVFSTKIN